jgi:hypothetical protein
MNWDRIEQLLKIAESSVKWPSLRPIHDAAMKELNHHAKQPRTPDISHVPQEPEPEPKPEGNGELKRRTLSE